MGRWHGRIHSLQDSGNAGVIYPERDPARCHAGEPRPCNFAVAGWADTESRVATPLETWVEESSRLTKPDQIVFCDGSESEYHRMIENLLAEGDTLALSEKTFPNCHLHRSSVNDVARTEHLTFICTPEKDDAGPTNNWMDPDAAKHKLGALFNGAMRGRTMYVVPYIMGPVHSPISKVGVEITDSPYVVASMRIMTRMGDVALKKLGSSAKFVPGLHSLGDLDPTRRYIVHFPQERL